MRAEHEEPEDKQTEVTVSEGIPMPVAIDPFYIVDFSEIKGIEKFGYCFSVSW